MIRLLILLAALSLPGLAAAAGGMKSILLLARAGLPDPNFRDSVVLVTQIADSAPIGVIINRPTEVRLAAGFPEIEGLAKVEDTFFFGGPVERLSVLFVFRSPTAPENATEVAEGVYLSWNGKLLRELLVRGKPTEGLRVYAGYSGWAPGQLENEIARGDWGLAPADAKAIFEKKPETLWKELTKRAGGKKVNLPAAP